MQTLRFYLDILRQLPTILRRTVLGYITVLTFIGSIIGYFGIKQGKPLVSWWENLSPWWGAVVPVLAVGATLLLIAVHERFQEIEREQDELGRQRNALEDELTKRENRELEARERWRVEDALDKYLGEMKEWVLDEENPLVTLTHDHPRRKIARTRTLWIVKRLDSQQKRDILMFLYEHGLVKKNGLQIVGLKDVDFSRADLTRLKLWEINLDGVNLSEANLSHTQLCAGHGHSASMQEAVAKGSSDLLADSIIPDRPSSLSGTDLSGAVLRRARLGDCNLVSANFDGADLTEADLRGAHLQIARNLTQEQIESAFGSSGGQEYMPNTLLPDYLTAPEAWKKLLSQRIEERDLVGDG